MATISTKGIYGLAALFHLSRAPEGKAMQIREIAAVSGISRAYLEQLLSTLRKAKLVQSVRGAQGGYLLARGANQITVLEIIETLEGPICEINGQNVGGSVILERFWQSMHDEVNGLFNMTLEALHENHLVQDFTI